MGSNIPVGLLLFSRCPLTPPGGNTHSTYRSRSCDISLISGFLPFYSLYVKALGKYLTLVEC